MKKYSRQLLILTFFFNAVIAQAQLYCIFDNPNLQVATSEISSDFFVNNFGDLTSDKYRVENVILATADLVKKYYYKGSTLVAQRNYSVEGHLTDDEDGISIYQYEYDTRGNVIKVQYFDEEKMAIQAAFLGPAMIKYEYNLHGNRIKAAYYNKYYELLETGASIIEYTYDDKGRVILEKQFGSDKELLKEIAPIIRYAYNEKGKMVKQEFLDANEQVVSRLMDDDEEDIASISYEYEGKIINMSFYNIKGVLLGTEKAEQKK